VSGGRVPDELDTWVLATAPRAIAYARSLLHNPDDADDVVQDCYCRLLAKADVYDLPRDGLKLLLTAITNACINLRTRRKPMFRLVRASAEGEEEGLAEAVAAGLGRLPPQQRTALELKAFGHSQHEIAEILGVSPNNAGVLVYRARQTLARHLAPFLTGEAES
jgi:RNA polymerase sigma factor (sigma-70 family)